MKRILVLNYEFPPLGGGAANATYYLLKEFAKDHGLEIDLVTSSVDKFRIEKFSNNITIHFLDIGKKGNLHYQSNKDLLTYSFKAYKYSKELMKKKQFDLCHAFFGIPCGYIAMKLGLSYIVSLRGSDVPGHNPKFKWVHKITGWMTRSVWKNAHAVVANSNDLKETALKFENSIEIRVIPNGVDCQRFSPGAKEDSIFRVIFAGRFHEVKGLNYLIEGFTNFSKDKSDIELLMVGEGGEFNNLKEQANKCSYIKLLGRVDQDCLIRLYKQSDVFILPSLNEGMSNALLEAMSCGLAIISTDTGGSKEFVTPSSGILIRKQHSGDILDALETMYENERFLEMKNSSRMVAGTYSWLSTANKYMSIYTEIK